MILRLLYTLIALNQFCQNFTTVPFSHGQSQMFEPDFDFSFILKLWLKVSTYSAYTSMGARYWKTKTVVN